MRRLFCLFVVLALSACSSSDGGGGGLSATDSCSNSDQKRFVRDFMLDWYLWNDLLPANINIGDYGSPEELLAFLTTFSPVDGSGQPIDRFSFITSAADDAAFLGEGLFEGFGFSSRFEAADDLRIYRVFTGSAAAAGGLARGQRILELNGRTIADIQAAEGVAAVFATTPLTLTLQDRGGNVLPPVTIEQSVFTIDPIPQWEIIDAGAGRMVGYMELAQFISTADAEFDTIFAAFGAAGVNDVIIDMRYNGGGLVSTAELLADYLGGDVAENLVFTDTRFNADRAADNDRTAFFGRRGNSISLSRLVVIATAGTASASEAIANGLEPHVDVTIVGSDTRGKPVGQVGFEFCEKIIRPTSFQLFNADGFGDYFDGLPVDCPAADDLNADVGENNDPNLVSALFYLENNACPVVLQPGGISKPRSRDVVAEIERRDSPTKEYLDAF